MAKTKKEIKTDSNKKVMLECLENSLGIVTTACKKANVARSQHYKWVEDDKDYSLAVDMVTELAIDFAESHLLENIKSKKETSIIFYLKCKAKKRGYVEKTEIDHTSKGEKINTIDLGKLPLGVLEALAKAEQNEDND